jgi:hypothetical protein
MKGKTYVNQYGIVFKAIQVFPDGDIVLKSIDSEPVTTITVDKNYLKDNFKEL